MKRMNKGSIELIFSQKYNIKYIFGLNVSFISYLKQGINNISKPLNFFIN